MSFSLTEVFVGRGQCQLAGQEALNSKHTQPTIHQLIKVEVCA